MDPRLRRFVPWALRAAWVLLVPLTGPAFAAALAPTSGPVRTTVSGGLWVVWAGTLLAALVLTPVTLTALRIVAPAAPVAALWAAATGRPSGVATAAAIAAAALAAAVALSPAVGSAFVNAPAYPNERRHLLRLPAALALGPVPLAWAVAVAAPTAVVLLGAARVWAGAAAALLLGAPATVLAVRSLHQLTLRWLVMVPAGVVVKDAMALAEPVLLRREVVEALRPAPAGSDSLDLTLGAGGLALELLLSEKVPMTLVKVKERVGEAGASARLLVTPTRPGAVLADAAQRSLPVG
ncbi:MAG: hypothetical protein ABIS47_06030 [Acidimicrobiales bacterium]